MAGLSSDWRHRRMTGSAFARYELRGTFHVVVLRALSGIEGESRGGEGGGTDIKFSKVKTWIFLMFFKVFASLAPPKIDSKTDPILRAS